MPTPNADVPPAVRELQGKTVEELLLLVGDEDLGFKPEAVELLLNMGLEANYPVQVSSSGVLCKRRAAVGFT